MALVSQYPRQRPADYPTNLEQEIVLADGDVLWVRPVVPSDSAALAAEFAAADEDTLYMRFFNPTFALTEERLRYFTELDYRSHLALAVMTENADGSEGVAIGRYAARSDSEVEAAVVVKTEYRQRGIARILLTTLGEVAAAAGYQAMSASYLEENTAAGSLLAACGFAEVSAADGIVEMKRQLQPDSAGVGSV